MQVITLFDFLLLPVYFLMLCMIVFRAAKKYRGTALRKYFLALFFMHVAGSVLHSIMLQYYYGSGDAFGYFEGGEFIKAAFLHSGKFIKVFFMDGQDLAALPGYNALSLYLQNSVFTPSSLSAIKFTGFFSLFSFSHFLINALFAGFISFIGVWKLFHVFNNITNKRVEKPLAIAMIYTPTIWFWGSGMGKDSISLGLLGILVSSIYYLVKKKRVFANLLFLFVSVYLLSSLKGVLLGVTAAASGIFLVVYIFTAVKNIFVKGVVFIVFALGSVLLFNMALGFIEQALDDAKLMIESNISTYGMESDQSGGGFKPPDFEVSPQGIIGAAPKTIFSTLYRPFIWEAGKAVILFSALESLLMLIFFLYVFLKGGMVNFFRSIFGSPYIAFCFSFVIVMAMIVGFTTFNSGTLVRYRLPLLPFYIFMLAAAFDRAKEKKLEKVYNVGMPPQNTEM